MSSVLEETNGERVFLIYGYDSKDMFFSGNLQCSGFRIFLTHYLRSIGFKQIVFYSSAGNTGKYVLDEDSAKLAINSNKNKKTAGNNQGTNVSEEKPKKKRRILNPGASSDENGIAADFNCKTESSDNVNIEDDSKIVYKQPKITAEDFLAEAKKIMNDGDCKSAIIFPNFLEDKIADMPQYQELVSYLWDEHCQFKRESICIFLAPNMSCMQLHVEFNESRSAFRRKFFEAGGKINSESTINIGLPNLDEIGYMMEYLRIVGDNGKKLIYKQSEKKRIMGAILYLSRDASTKNENLGSMRSIYGKVVRHMKKQTNSHVEFNEDIVKKLFYSEDKIIEQNPMEKLRNTKGWESVADRIEQIIKDCRSKKQEAKGKKPVKKKCLKKPYAIERIDNGQDKSSYRYDIPCFVLKGNPGVGKTTIARLIGQIFYEEGILLKGTTIEARRDTLVGQYVGETAIKTDECFKRAEEGVLFIDDAYSLIEESKEHNYSQEAIDTMVPIMTDKRYHVCLIMAGYPQEMDRLLEMNPGLVSRFGNSNIITIEDYKPDLLKTIFINECRKEGYTFDGENEGNIKYDLDLFFNNLYNQRSRTDFGNARTIVALSKEVKMQCSLRDDNSRRIILEDFGESKKYFAKRDVSSIDEIYKKIDEYVGMEFLKKELFDKIKCDEYRKMDNKRKGIKDEDDGPEHYIFAGNPGVGKTTIGKLTGLFYHITGVLGGEETLYVDASHLIGNHVGDSKNKIIEKMQEAINNNQVLYIDEAYQISDSPYGPEIIGAMMTMMTENAGNFKVIFGMYPDKLEDFLNINSGLRSRLEVINFPDYTPEQLLEIFDRTVKKHKCTITDEAHERVKLILNHKYNVREKSFGNAREVKKIYKNMEQNRFMRINALENQIESVDRDEYILEDIPGDLLKAVDNQVNKKSLNDILNEINQRVGMNDLKKGECETFSVNSDLKGLL